MQQLIIGRGLGARRGLELDRAGSTSFSACRRATGGDAERAGHRHHLLLQESPSA